MLSAGEVGGVFHTYKLGILWITWLTVYLVITVPSSFGSPNWSPYYNVSVHSRSLPHRIEATAITALQQGDFKQCKIAT